MIERREVTWTLGNGKIAKFVVELQTEKVAYADGYNVRIPCCEMHMHTEVEGMGVVGYGKPYERDGLPQGAVAATGKVGIKAEQYTRILTAIAEVEATPEWQAKLAANRASEQTRLEYEEHDAMMHRVMAE